MKKLILMVALAVVMVGCGGEPTQAETGVVTQEPEEVAAEPTATSTPVPTEPVTEAEVVGYWIDENNNLYRIEEGGMWSVYTSIMSDDEEVGKFAFPIGMMMFLGDRVTLTLSGSLTDDGKSITAECTFSEDRNTMTMELDGETSVMYHISSEQAAELGVE